MTHSLKLLEQIAGALLMLLVLADVFLTVLYARIRSGIISPHLARIVWYGFRALGRRIQVHRGKLLSICGPSILVMLVLVWGFGLVIGAALILHPNLGTTIKANSGETQTDFLTAIYAAGSSIAVVGSSDYEPQNGPFKMFYLLNSLIGISMLSLTLTYLMQVYTALLRRNSVGLSLHIGTDLQGDASELVKGVGPEGRFEIGYLTLTQLAGSLQQMKEAHHFYPVLFYFRFEEPYYSVSQITNVALDTVTIIRSALDQECYRWLVESGAVSDIWQSARLLLVTLENAFVTGGAPHAEQPDPQTRGLWRRRFLDAVAKLQAGNIQVAANLEAAAESYIALRSTWGIFISRLAPP
jgi:Ion channel